MHEQLFEEFIRSMNVKRVANVIADYEWGHSIREAVERVAARTGIELRTEVAPLTESDFTPYLRRLKDLNPELIIATGHPPGLAAIVKQSLEVGINAKWITGSVPPATPLVSALGELAFGRVLLTNCANYESPEYVALAERFRERFGALMEQFAVTGYVTVMMIADAIEKTGSTDPKAIADHVRNGRYVSPSTYSVAEADVPAYLVAAIGGLGNPVGALLGGAVILALKELTRAVGPASVAVYGLALLSVFAVRTRARKGARASW
jgi:ABC-type branched-subunit amino acid transport system substrate-binding protein